ncbi:hypothetical protein ACTJIV_03250 [Chryseobacterium sp. 22532]|uniref:hypothetical protein n=1 Tax=Chryseobacterium sp. 22532 TaxID=3453938 RepID=UPI003F84ECE0
MKNIKKIFLAFAFGTLFVSCRSEAELSDEELKSIYEKEFRDFYKANHMNNGWPQNTWNNGMSGIKKIRFGKDLPSVSTKTVDQSEEIPFGKK